MSKDKEKEKKQSIFETVRQVDELEKQKKEKSLENALKKEEKLREEYGKSLNEEKIELLKLKQGVIDKSEKLDLKPDVKKEYTLWQKIKNFIYHSKWWLGITSFFVLVAVFLIYDTVTTTKPDIMIMLLCDNTEVYANYEQMTEYFNEFTEDYNEDDELYANILYIPISNDPQADNVGLYESNLTKLSAEFQMGETMLVIADGKSADLVVPDENLVNLEELFPDNPHVKGYGYSLKNTGFAEAIGLDESQIPDDMYIGVRKVTKTLTSEKNTKKHYDYAMDTLEKVMEDLSK